MANMVLVKAKPSGFLMIKADGSVYLKASEVVRSARVGGEEWDVESILAMKPGDKDINPESKWEVRREDKKTIVFEMIDPESKVDWGVPLKMSVDYSEVVAAVNILVLD